MADSYMEDPEDLEPLPEDESANRTEPPQRTPGEIRAFLKKIILEHNGTISVSSSPGQGATFTFSLPLSA